MWVCQSTLILLTDDLMLETSVLCHITFALFGYQIVLSTDTFRHSQRGWTRIDIYNYPAGRVFALHFWALRNATGGEPNIFWNPLHTCKSYNSCIASIAVGWKKATTVKGDLSNDATPTRIDNRTADIILCQSHAS